MDSGTHLVMGLGLAGLAYVDPVVSSNHALSTAVLIATVLGSQAPDTDGFLRLRGNAVYIRNHRGISHSIPFLFIWTSVITFLLSSLFGNISVGHLALWTFIAVSIHVFTDLFNTYGTQGFRPFTEKWISLNIIHIFDPFIFSSHVIAILLWMAGVSAPQIIFTVLYLLIGLYYAWRISIKMLIQKRVPKWDADHHSGDAYTIIPTINLNIWNVVKRKANGDYSFGELKNDTLRWIDIVRGSNHPAAEATKTHPDVSSFLYFSSYACPEVKKHAWGYEIRWIDVRYRHRRQYPFVAVVLLNLEYEAFDSYVGWLSDTRLEKKLRLNNS